MSTLATSRLSLRLPRAPRVLELLALRRQREQLANLDAAALADIGLTRAEAQAEAGRSFWDAPCTWTY